MAAISMEKLHRPEAVIVWRRLRCVMVRPLGTEVRSHRGQRRTAIVSAAVGCVTGIALVMVIHLLRHTDNPWAWIGLPMACRYTLRGC
jgi:hypothetical protein